MMTKGTRRIGLVLAVLVAAPAALAITDGWDMDREIPVRTWTSARLTWAADIHPAQPTHGYLLANVDPPPREMWCMAVDPWPLNCDAWEAHMDTWLHHYLDIPYDDPLPPDLDAFPKECASSCNNNF